MTAISLPRAFLPRAGRRIAPKAALAAAGLVALTVVTPVDTAHAIPPQSAPWCAAMGGSWGFDCSYFTFEQCMETARGLGNYCSPNPNAVVPPRTKARQQRPRYYIDQWGRRVRIR